MTAPRYSDVRFQLTGEDRNAFAVLSKVRGALRKAGASETVIAEFTAEAISGDYDHLLATCMRWVDVS
jgi:hypothetical protein